MRCNTSGCRSAVHRLGGQKTGGGRGEERNGGEWVGKGVNGVAEELWMEDGCGG